MARFPEVLARFDNEPSRDKSLTDEERNTLDNDIDEVLRLIANCEGFQAAESSLLALGEIHKVLATLAFRFGVSLSPRQRRIVREYDRWDVPEVRHAVFSAIRRGEFP